LYFIKEEGGTSPAIGGRSVPGEMTESRIKALTYCLSSSICPDVARSLDEDFDSSHSSAAFGLSFLSSRGRYGGLAVGFKLTFSSIYCKNEVFEGEGTALIHF